MTRDDADRRAWGPVDEIRRLADEAWVRLVHAHPFFFAANHPIPEATR